MTDSAGFIPPEAIDSACALVTAMDHSGEHLKDVAREVVNDAHDSIALEQRFVALGLIANLAIVFAVRVWQTAQDAIQPGAPIDEAFGTVEGVRSQVFESLRQVVTGDPTA